MAGIFSTPFRPSIFSQLFPISSYKRKLLEAREDLAASRIVRAERDSNHDLYSLVKFVKAEGSVVAWYDVMKYIFKTFNINRSCSDFIGKDFADKIRAKERQLLEKRTRALTNKV